MMKREGMEMPSLFLKGVVMEAGIGAVITIFVSPFLLLKLYLQSKEMKKKDAVIDDYAERLGKK